jgi:hypothetical protein
MLKRLLSEGADPNYRVEWCNDGSPTLHQWALYAHVEAVQLLLDHGADINILDNLGRSALEYATGALNWSETTKAEQVVKLIIGVLPKIGTRCYESRLREALPYSK